MENRTRNQQEYWNKLAERYNHRFNYHSACGEKKIERKAELIIAHAGIGEDTEVLELGCGTGTFTSLFARTNAHITAIDLSSNMLKVASKTHSAKNIIYQWDDVHKLTYPDNSFDAIVGCYILQYLDLKKAIPEIKRVLVPGGRIAFIDINTLNPVAFAKTKIPLVKKMLGISKEAESFIPGELCKWFAQHGFVDIQVTTFEFGSPTLNLLGKVPVLRHFAGNLLITAKINLLRRKIVAKGY